MATTSDVNEIKRNMEQNFDKYMRALALEAVNRIVQRTPVDTGRAKGNWNLAIGEMDDSTTENTDKSGTITIARARSRSGP